MSAIDFQCDMCGVIGAKGFVHDYDNVDRCASCDIKYQIQELKREIKEKSEWLEDTYLKPLREKEEKLKKLETQLGGDKK